MKKTLNTQERTNTLPAYEAPQVEIFEVQVERGYEGSDITGYGLDSNDSDFGYSSPRSTASSTGTWGEVW